LRELQRDVTPHARPDAGHERDLAVEEPLTHAQNENTF
jgi:hypothetical protein